MTVHVSPEHEAKLAELATRTGRQVDELVHVAIESLVTEQAERLEAIDKGFAQLDRGEFVTHEALEARIERIFRS